MRTFVWTSLPSTFGPFLRMFLDRPQLDMIQSNCGLHLSGNCAGSAGRLLKIVAAVRTELRTDAAVAHDGTGKAIHITDGARFAPALATLARRIPPS